jgi:hypothetical protein
MGVFAFEPGRRGKPTGSRSSSVAADRHERRADGVAEQITRGDRALSAGLDHAQPGGDPAELRLADRATRGGGHQLPGPARARFDRWFGRDFSSVRVHTSDAAAGIAESLQARAFTAGRDIVFGPREYAPSTAEGQRLLAHELAHVVQQSGPGASAVRTVQKAPKKKQKKVTPSYYRDLALTPGDAPADHEDLVDDLAQLVSLMVAGRNDGETDPRRRPRPALLWFRDNWPRVAALILTPDAAGKRSPSDDLPDQELVDRLSALSPEERVSVAAEIERRVLAAFQTVPVADLAAEYATLIPRVRDLMAGSFLGWVAMREGMFRCFVDVAGINGYYGSLVVADFPSAKVPGHQTLVHKDLKVRLDRAKQLITARGWLPLVEAALIPDGLWATIIRENTANPVEVGAHAFGWAMDLAAKHNPDIRPFPELFTEVTKVDAGAGTDVMALRDPKTGVDAAVGHARVLRQTSDDIVAAFASETAVLTAISAYLSRHGAGTLDAADRAAVGALVRDAAAARGKAALGTAVAALTGWVLARQDRQRAQLAPSDPAGTASYGSAAREDSRWVTQMSARLRRLSRSPADLDTRLALIERQIATPVTTAPKDAKGLGLEPIYTRDSVKVIKAMDAGAKYFALLGLRNNLRVEMERALATDTAARVLELHRMFLAAEVERPREPEIRPTAAGVAAHGWVSLPPELIGALTGAEGAGLAWLGVMLMKQKGHPQVLGAKDSMHFELRENDRPALPAGRYPDVLRGGSGVPTGDFPTGEDADSA